jgi:RNA polymerase sigma factor (TIGR02999 family)
MTDPLPEQLTELLHRWSQGDGQALARLTPIVYGELRRLAHAQLSRERADHTLQTTALVHEAFMRLLGSQSPQLQSRAQFVGVASRLMRQVLVDYARQRLAGKRDGGQRVELEAISGLPIADDGQLIALDDALAALSQVDERQARVVDLKFFGGLTAPEIAELLGVSLTTVERDWSVARLWLRREMDGTGGP